MSSSGAVGEQRGLAREWLIARLVIIGGFLIAIAGAVYYFYVEPKIIAPQEARAQLQARVQRILQEEADVCTMALQDAKNYGIVPQYGRLATLKLAGTNVPGRYVCVAATHVAKYLLIVDLVCHNHKDPRCTSLYNVTQGNGATLYQRQS